MRRFRDPAARKLVAECDRFLRGCYADDLAAAGLPVPVWAWTNLLAHGTTVQLGRIVGTAPGPPAGPAAPGPGPGPVAGPFAGPFAGPGQWARARSFLAGEILELVDGRPPRLDALQRSVLIPLELDLSSQSMVAWWQPGRLVATVLAALRPSGSPRRPGILK